MKPNSDILISRILKENSELRTWLEKAKCSLIEQAFISFVTQENLEIPETDWIFFSSPTGLKLYLDKYPLKAKKIGVYSSGTLEALKSYGFDADYVGDSHLNSDEIGKDFFSFLDDNEFVLFPLSQISMKGISSQGKQSQVIEIVSYHTNLKSVKLKQVPDYIIFTSPSNVDGYLSLNEIKKGMGVIAFGNATTKHLEKYMDRERILVPNSPSESDLILLLKSLA